MRTKNLIPKISLLLVTLVVLYVFIWAFPPRIVEPNTTGEQLELTVIVLQLVLPLSFLPAFFLGIWRACKAADYPWLVIQLAFFPSTYIYTLLINRGLGANNSFKPNPLRGSA